MVSRTRNDSSLNSVQIVFEIFVAVGYFIGLTPFMYLFAMIWVIPFTIVNIIFSIINKNKTWPFTSVNFLMALLSLIPVLGYLFRVVGLIMSSLSVLTIMKKI